MPAALAALMSLGLRVLFRKVACLVLVIISVALDIQEESTPYLCLAPCLPVTARAGNMDPCSLGASLNSYTCNLSSWKAEAGGSPQV